MFISLLLLLLFLLLLLLLLLPYLSPCHYNDLCRCHSAHSCDNISRSR
jgi:hypothetical protein